MRDNRGDRRWPSTRSQRPPGQASPSQAAATTWRWSRSKASTPRSSKDPTDEDGFIKFCQDADAVYAKGIRFSKKIIDGLPERVRGIILGSVGVDSVDVKAATERGIPVTNCPDTFIEEVADHAMMLLLSSFRRTIEQDRMVREGNWREGRPALLGIPAPDGPDAWA